MSFPGLQAHRVGSKLFITSGEIDEVVWALKSTVGIDGSPVRKCLSAVATLNFAAPGAVPGSVDLTIAVPGAALGDTVSVGCPVTVGANYLLTAFVSAAGVVTVRWTQIAGAAADPDGAGGVYRVEVLQH